MQIFVPMQHVMSALSTSDSIETGPLDSAAAARLLAANEAYRRQVASLSLRVRQLQETNRELTRVRDRGLNVGRLIPAQIVAGDSLPWRDSRLIDQGTLRGVRRGHTVVSNYGVTAGQNEGVQAGMSILVGESLVGEIVQVSTHTSRVLLITDPEATPRWIRVGHQTEQGIVYVREEMLLKGVGNGRMRISDVSHDYIERQEIELGDWVVSTGADRQLPVQLVVGRIVDMRRDDDNAVLYNLTVEPLVDVRQLRRVYIVDNELN